MSPFVLNPHVMYPSSWRVCEPRCSKSQAEKPARESEQNARQRDRARERMSYLPVQVGKSELRSEWATGSLGISLCLSLRYTQVSKQSPRKTVPNPRRITRISTQKKYSSYRGNKIKTINCIAECSFRCGTPAIWFPC